MDSGSSLDPLVLVVTMQLQSKCVPGVTQVFKTFRFMDSMSTIYVQTQ